MKKVINTGKSEVKTLSEVKPVKSITKNPQSFLEINPVQKYFLHINCNTMYMNNKILLV